MSRAAVFDAILADPTLSTAGWNSDNVIVGYDGDQRPNDKMFMVLRWETDETELSGDDGTVQRGPRNLTIWVHMYRGFSTDFVRLDDLLDQLDDILSNIIDTPGTDGRTVTLIEPQGHSRDLRDVTYDTLCRSATYKVLTRRT